MVKHSITAEPQGPALEAYLLGKIEYDVCLALQKRLVYEISGRSDGQIALVVCEHPPVITIGRRGSRGHIAIDDAELVSRRIELRWVNRGDGCMLHLPGQLAVYPIVPLEWHGFSVGEYLDRLQSGLHAALAGLRMPLLTRPTQHGIWLRGGQVAAIGVAVKRWTAYHGAFINVHPAPELYPSLNTDPTGGTRMTTLLAERGRPVKMTTIRSEIVRQLANALDCDRHHLFTSHPLLPEIRRQIDRGTSRVG